MSDDKKNSENKAELEKEAFLKALGDEAKLMKQYCPSIIAQLVQISGIHRISEGDTPITLSKEAGKRDLMIYLLEILSLADGSLGHYLEKNVK